MSGPRVAVRPQLPWLFRVMLACSVLGVAFGVGLAVGALRTDRSEGEQGIDSERLRAQLAQAVADRDREAAAAANWESWLRVEQSAQERLAAQMKALEDENARIRSDLEFFESLLPMPANAKGVVIRSFRVQPEGDGGLLRYRLLVQQSGRPERDFIGTVRLTVTLQQADRHEALQVPDPAGPDAGSAPLAFRHYQRVEGTFAVPAGATVRSVFVRVLSNGGELRAQQTFTM